MTRPPRITPIAINLAPMVDVMMCMLIFFMLATKMVERENSTIDLPLALAAKEIDKSSLGNRFVVNVRHAPAGVQYVVGEDVVSADEVSKRLRIATGSQGNEINFIIRGERNVAYRHVEELLKICRDEKVRNVTFSALQGEGGGLMRRREMPHTHVEMPNLAPMVDVVMCILIFFMLGTSFALSEGALPTQLPTQVGPGGASVVSVVPVVRIALREDGQRKGSCKILVMEKQLPAHTFAALRAFMDEKRDAGADPTGRVVISAEPSVEYQNLISAMDACVRAGFSNIQFALNSGPAPADGAQEP